MPTTVTLNSPDLSWFVAEKYAPLKGAPLNQLYQVLNDRVQLRASVPYAPFLALTENRADPDEELSSQALRQELAKECGREDVALPARFKQLFTQIQSEPLSPLFPDPLLAEPSPPPPPAVAPLSKRRIFQLASRIPSSQREQDEPWNDPAIGGQSRGFVEVDLLLPDSAIESAFKSWLKQARRTFAVGFYNRPLEELFQRGAIQLIDIEFFRLLRQTELRIVRGEPELQVRLPDELLYRLIFPQREDEAMESLLKTAVRHKDTLLRTPHILARLEALRRTPPES